MFFCRIVPKLNGIYIILLLDFWESEIYIVGQQLLLIITYNKGIIGVTALSQYNIPVIKESILYFNCDLP